MTDKPSQPHSSTVNEFFVVEICVYAVQVITFAVVAWAVSGFFQDEALLTKHLSDKINELSIREFFATLITILCFLGLLWAFKEKTESKFFDKIMPAIYDESARTVYLFGSSIGGTLLASGVYLAFNPTTKSHDFRLGVSSILLSLLFVVVFFLVGFALKTKPKAAPTVQSPAPSQ